MESLLRSNNMGIFDDKYLSNTQKVYKDFEDMSKDLEKAKSFIRRIPKYQLLKYKEIVFSEHEIANNEYNLAINLYFVIIYSLVQILFTIILLVFRFNELGVTIYAPIFTAIVFIVWINRHNIKRQNRNLYRLLYFLEHI